MNDRFCLPKDPYDDLGFLFWQIMKSWQRAKHKLLDEFDITPSQLEVLSAIYHLATSQQEITQVAISNLINVDPMTTSSILRKLENKKLINRRQSEIDTRARTVELTEDGTSKMIAAITKVKNSTDELLDVVDEERLKKDFKVLLNVLTKIYN